MKCLKTFLVAAVAIAGLSVVAGPSVASAETVLCTEKSNPCTAEDVDGVGTEIKLSLVPGTTAKFTSFLTDTCKKSSITAKVTSVGEKVKALIENFSFGECNCEPKVFKLGFIELQSISGTANATIKINETESKLGGECGLFGCSEVIQFHETDFGTLEGGNPAKWKVESSICRGQEIVFEAEYEVTSPKPLYIEPKVAAPSTKTILCTVPETHCPGGAADGEIGSEIKLSSIGTSKLTTTFKNIECSKASINGKVIGAGEKIKASVEALSFEECNCEVKVLQKGTFKLKHSSGVDATFESSGTEVTTSCSTIFGTVHCVYATEKTDFGTVTGGNPAVLDIESANVPRSTTNALCDEQANWDVKYEVTSPKPLYIEPE